MKIVELRAQGFARLNAIEIRPDGAVVPITGKNGQGKTSTLRAIWALIEGKAAAPAVSIREGEHEATLYGDLGAYKITRTIKHDTERREEWTLKVVDADGTRITKSPQALIDRFKGDIGFDPLGWTRLKPADQAAALRSLVEGFDFEANAEERAGAFADRTDVNRRVKTAQAAADKVILPEGSEPKPILIHDKLDELTEARATNARAEAHRMQAAAFQREADSLDDEAEQLRARAATRENQAKAKRAEAEALLAPVKDFKPIDTAAIEADIARAQAVDTARQAFQRRRDLEKEASDAQAESTALTTKIEGLDKARHDAIASAKLPVEGLALGEDSVLLHGLPLAQAGTAEKIEVALAIAMAKNPELKVILIDEGSELDSEAMAFVARMAEERGFQVWIARVDESREVGFVIEDGRVAT